MIIPRLSGSSLDFEFKRMYENKQNTSQVIPLFDKNRNENYTPCVFVLLFTVSLLLKPF